MYTQPICLSNYSYYLLPFSSLSSLIILMAVGSRSLCNSTPNRTLKMPLQSIPSNLSKMSQQICLQWNLLLALKHSLHLMILPLSNNSSLLISNPTLHVNQYGKTSIIIKKYSKYRLTPLKTIAPLINLLTISSWVTIWLTNYVHKTECITSSQSQNPVTATAYPTKLVQLLIISWFHKIIKYVKYVKEIQ